MPRLAGKPEDVHVSVASVTHVWANGPHRWQIDVEAFTEYARLVRAPWETPKAADFLPMNVRAALVAWLTADE